jgi:hypothetical protein
MTIAEWDKDLRLTSIKHYDDFKGNQKNWCLFENQKKIFMVTDFSPFCFYQLDPNTFELSNKKEWNHDFKNYRGCKVYHVENNKIKCMAHKRVNFNVFYNFSLFEINMDTHEVNQISPEMSLRRYYGLMIQYPHMIQKIKDKYYLTLGIEDNQSMILEWKDQI